MGLLDSILEVVEGQHSSQHIIQIMSQLIEECGGSDALLDKFKQNGFEELLTSMLDKGSEQPLSIETIRSVLGKDVLQQVATKVGLNVDQVSASLSKYLPSLISQLNKSGDAQWDLSKLGGDWLKSLLK